MASTTDLLMMYLAVELVSLVSYAVAGYRKGDRKAGEAALKYVDSGIQFSFTRCDLDHDRHCG